jgi:hypothetical protein
LVKCVCSDGIIGLPCQRCVCWVVVFLVVGHERGEGDFPVINVHLCELGGVVLRGVVCAICGGVLMVGEREGGGGGSWG